jgi:hypothetical protein
MIDNVSVSFLVEDVDSIACTLDAGRIPKARRRRSIYAGLASPSPSGK